MWPQFPVPSGIHCERWFPVRTRHGVHVFSWSDLLQYDSWRFSTPIVEATETDDGWKLTTRSGSVYFIQSATFGNHLADVQNINVAPTYVVKEAAVLNGLRDSGPADVLSLCDFEIFLEDQFGL